MRDSKSYGVCCAREASGSAAIAAAPTIRDHLIKLFRMSVPL
jgi:hypothetical protein